MRVPIAWATFILLASHSACATVGAHTPPVLPATGTPEATLLELTNAERQAAGLVPLRWHASVAKVARAHSQEMRARRFVGHVSPTTGDPQARLKAAGLRFPLSAENVSKAASAEHAHELFMASPGHRANILRPPATHVGIGVVSVAASRDQLGHIYVTEVFVQDVGVLDLNAQQQRVVAAIQTRRNEGGRKPLQTSDVLRRVAQAVAEKLATSGGELSAAAKASLLGAADARFQGVSLVVSIAADPIALVSHDRLLEDATHIGVAVAQGSHPRVGDGAVYCVAVLGRRRAATTK